MIGRRQRLVLRRRFVCAMLVAREPAVDRSVCVCNVGSKGACGPADPFVVQSGQELLVSYLREYFEEKTGNDTLYRFIL